LENPASSSTELASLQKELASRKSVLHFAHSSVSMVLALIAAGTVAKLLWDVGRYPETELYVVPVAIFSALCFGYAIVRYVLGKRELKKELVSFAQLQVLRRQLNLEDPSALLP
jgi:hypothetical protein